MTNALFSVSTESKAIQFQVVGSVLDLDEKANMPMKWEITIRKDGKEIDKRTLEFKDGHIATGNDLNLYFD